MFNKINFSKLTYFIFLIILIAQIACENKVCLTDKCLRSSKYYKDSMNLTVDPCDDFYTYTCGNWGKEHPNLRFFTTRSTFTRIEEEQAFRLKEFFETDPSVNEPEAVKKARRLFASCINTTTVKEADLSDFYLILKRLKLPIVPSFFVGNMEDRNTFTFHWLKTIPKLKKFLDTEILLASPIVADPFNSTHNVIYIRMPEQNMLTFRFSFKNDEEVNSYTIKDLGKRIKKANMFKYLVKVIMEDNDMEVPSETILEEAAMYIMNMTDFMEKLIPKYSVGQNDDTTILRVPLVKLQDDLNKNLNTFTNRPYPDFFKYYFEYLFEDTGEILNEKSDLIYSYVVEQKYFAEALAFLLDTPDIYIELYLWWMSAFSIIMKTSFKDDFLFPMKATPPKWLECAVLVGTEMGLATTYIMADINFMNKTKPKFERMFQELQTVFDYEVNQLTWMDVNTKRVTLEQNDAIFSFIGYPDWLLDKKSLDNFYENIEIKSDTLLQNLVNTQEQIIFSNINSLRKVNSRRWRMNPNKVNAFYIREDNTINIPQAMLKFPIYDLGLEVLNYGALGSIVGHELTHRFDMTGFLRDKHGNFHPWLTFFTALNFITLTRCFIDQYHNFIWNKIHMHVDSGKSLLENIADNGGLNRAFKAYNKYLEEYGDDEKLPGFEQFTSQQMFFIAFGSVWCETASPYSTKRALSSTHLPNSVRVTVTLQNSADFSKAFGCTKDTKMNPAKKCKIW